MRTGRTIASLVALLLAAGSVAACEYDETDAGAGADKVVHRDGKTDPVEPAAVQPSKRKTQKAKPEPPRSWLVTRVIDGDTIELGNGASVRIIGIDTPEQGECGYQMASDHMSRLVLGKRVVLSRVGENTDRYGRWLRYVNIGRMDAGLRQIRRGFAIARYDSRDGYGRHPRQTGYIRLDRQVRNFTCTKPVPVVGSACAAGYSPCIPPYPPDVDCDDVNGPIMVTGSDPHGLDADGDGVACE